MEVRRRQSLRASCRRRYARGPTEDEREDSRQMSDRDAFLKDLADSRLRLKKWRTERAGKDGSTLLSDALTVLDTLERSIRAGGSSVETANLGFQLGYLVGH